MHHLRRLALTLAAVGSAVVLAACGGSSGKSTGSGSSFASGLKFSDCMRSHGVPNFPDPSGGGGGIQISAGSGVNPQSPAFQSAQNDCQKLMPGGGPLHGPVSEARKLAMLHLSQCMRRHGFTTFPDPTSNPPSPGNGLGIAFGGQGSFIAVPQSMLQAPGFQQAAAVCGFPGGGHRPSKSQAPAG